MSERSPRVLIVPSWYPSKNSPTAGVFIQQQVRALSRVADVAVLHVSTQDGELAPAVTSEDGATVVRASMVASSLYDRFFGYRRLGLAAFDVLKAEWGLPEILHVQALFPAAIIGRAIARNLGVPYVITEHSEEYLAHSQRRLVRTPGMVPLVLRPMALGAARNIAVSRFLADRLVELGLAKNPVVIPNVVPVSQPIPLPTGAPHVITHVSVMGPAKNLTALINAVDTLRHERTDFRLRLVGEGECREDIERQVAELGLGAYVEFTGRKSLDEVHALLASSAFTVISSTHETFSVSAAESLMCGRPVLSTRCGGPDEFITPQVGKLVDCQSVPALAEGLAWMLQHFQGFDSEALHEYAVERFSPDAVASQILRVYREVQGSR